MTQVSAKFQARKAKLKNLTTRIFNGKSLVLSQSTPYEVIAEHHQTKVRYYAAPEKSLKNLWFLPHRCRSIWRSMIYTRIAH